MSIIYTIHPRWTISNRIILALTIDRITNDHTIHIYAAKQSNSCCHCRTNIIWISIIIHLKFISANDLGWISKLHMTLQIIIKICRGNIFHRLCQFHILSLWIHRINLYISRHTTVSIIPPFEETRVLQSRNFHRLSFNTDLRIIRFDLVLADHIRQRTNLTITKYPGTLRIHQCNVCNLIRLLYILRKFPFIYRKQICIGTWTK